MASFQPPGRNDPIVEPGLILTQRGNDWAQNVTNLSILEGTGSPEGVITAQRTRLYLSDTDQLFIKTTSGGNTGWREIQLV